eukprot:3806504-Prymnesium_polylepis.1
MFKTRAKAPVGAVHYTSQLTGAGRAGPGVSPCAVGPRATVFSHLRGAPRGGRRREIGRFSMIRSAGSGPVQRQRSACTLAVRGCLCGVCRIPWYHWHCGPAFTSSTKSQSIEASSPPEARFQPAEAKATLRESPKRKSVRQTAGEAGRRGVSAAFSGGSGGGDACLALAIFFR